MSGTPAPCALPQGWQMRLADGRPSATLGRLTHTLCGQTSQGSYDLMLRPDQVSRYVFTHECPVR